MTTTTTQRVLNLRGRRGVLPEGAEYIGGRVYRGGWRLERLERSKWANPDPNATREEREETIAKYELYFYARGLINDVHELRGKDLACWCTPKPVTARCFFDSPIRLNTDPGDELPGRSGNCGRGQALLPAVPAQVFFADELARRPLYESPAGLSIALFTT